MKRFSYGLLVPILLLLVGVKPSSAGPFFNIPDCGAGNDGSASATEAIRAVRR